LKRTTDLGVRKTIEHTLELDEDVDMKGAVLDCGDSAVKLPDKLLNLRTKLVAFGGVVDSGCESGEPVIDFTQRHG
jgi:hypothetical protein